MDVSTPSVGLGRADIAFLASHSFLSVTDQTNQNLLPAERTPPPPF
jgi:hypothetical protein